MVDYKIWKENIYNSIKDFSDKETQEIGWMGKDPNIVASFSEDVAMLYDSYCFDDDFWEEKHLSQFHFTNNILKELQEFKTMLDNYYKEEKLKDLSHEEILKDPNWDKVVNQAKKVIAIWE